MLPHAALYHAVKLFHNQLGYILQSRGYLRCVL